MVPIQDPRPQLLSLVAQEEAEPQHECAPQSSLQGLGGWQRPPRRNEVEADGSRVPGAAQPWHAHQACQPSGITEFEASRSPGGTGPSPAHSAHLLQTCELEGSTKLLKKFFYCKIIFMVPLTRTLWQMHNSELHVIVFTLKTAIVDLVIFIPVSNVNVYLTSQQFDTGHPGTEVLQHCICQC